MFFKATMCYIFAIPYFDLWLLNFKIRPGIRKIFCQSCLQKMNHSISVWNRMKQRHVIKLYVSDMKPFLIQKMKDSFKTMTDKRVGQNPKGHILSSSTFHFFTLLCHFSFLFTIFLFLFLFLSTPKIQIVNKCRYTKSRFFYFSESLNILNY